jgi:hypothetical protein
LGDEGKGLGHIFGAVEQGVAHGLRAAFLEASLHRALGFDVFHLGGPEARSDFEGFPQTGVHLQPPLVVAFDVIDLAVFGFSKYSQAASILAKLFISSTK